MSTGFDLNHLFMMTFFLRLLFPKTKQIDETLAAARLFQCDMLESWCVNVRDNDPDLNPSIGLYCNEQAGQVQSAMKRERERA